jgi:ABC-type hemin transport system substrate-binding protein
MRLVSLVPSLTHMAVDLGLEASLVGVTRFCVEPPRLARTATIVGGTKDPDLARIDALAPTHVLVNDEENKPEHVAALAAKYPVFRCLPKHPRDVPALLRDAGAFLGVASVAAARAREAEAALAEVDAASRARRAEGEAPPRVLYFIWREPYMVVSDDTYIGGMLALAGLANVAPATPRYPTLTVEEAAAAAPDLLLLSSEPYPFRERDAARLRATWPAGAKAPRLAKIDGQLASWYGTMAAPALRALAAWMRGDPQQLVRPFAAGGDATETPTSNTP